MVLLTYKNYSNLTIYLFFTSQITKTWVVLQGFSFIHTVKYLSKFKTENMQNAILECEKWVATYESWYPMPKWVFRKKDEPTHFSFPLLMIALRSEQQCLTVSYCCTGYHNKQTHNHWLVKPSQHPVDPGTRGSKRQHRSWPWSQNRHYINTVHSTYGSQFSLCNGRVASVEYRWRRVSRRPTRQNPYGAPWQCQSVPTLATWPDQRPVRDSGSTTQWTFSVASRLLSPDRAPGLRHLSILQWCWRDGRTPGATVPSLRPGPAEHLARKKV